MDYVLLTIDHIKTSAGSLVPDFEDLSQENGSFIVIINRGLVNVRSTAQIHN